MFAHLVVNIGTQGISRSTRVHICTFLIQHTETEVKLCLFTSA